VRAVALVVAVENYGDPELNLEGPADDAIRVRDWLLKEGSVAAADMTVLVSPRDEWAHVNEIDGDATLDTVFGRLFALGELVGVDRVYFYFSGHGLSVASDKQRQYLLLAGFHEKKAPYKAVAFQEVASYLQTLAPEHLLISDACRDFRYEWRPATIGTLLPDQWMSALPDGRPSARGGQLFAASPGGVAYMSPDGQPVGSVFTTELIDGLAGTGCAKRWDPDQSLYVVDASQVVRYVRQAVAARLAEVPEVDADGVAAGIMSITTNDPLVLRVMREADVPKVRLSVGLLPDRVAHSSPALQVMLYGFVHKKWRPAVFPVTRFMLQPRSYSLRARAIGYRQETVPHWDVYADQEESAWLVPSGDRDGGGAGPPKPPSPRRGQAAPGTLLVHSDDRLLPYELASESGAIVSVGVGNHTYQLSAGYYRVRPLVGGAGTFGDRPTDRFYTGSHITGPEWLVRVDSDAESSVRLPAAKALPSPLHAALLRVIGEDLRGTPGWASWFGTETDPPVSSLLAYLAELRTRDLLSRPAWPAVPAWFTSSPVMVLAAVDGGREDEARELIGQLEVQFPEQDYAVGRPLRLGQLSDPRLALATVTASPGALAVRVGPRDGDSIDVRVPVLAGRSTVLIWHVDQAGQLAVRLACPAPDGPEPAPSDYGRRIDLMQQLVAIGRPTAMRRVAEPLLSAGSHDPVAALIAATPRSREPEPVDRPRREAPTPPAIVADDHVFWAARLEALGLRQQARDRFRELAAEDALPVTAAATRLLCAGLLRYAPESLRATQLRWLLRNQILGSPWSAAWVETTTEQGLPNPPGTHQGSPTEAVPVPAPQQVAVQLSAYA